MLDMRSVGGSDSTGRSGGKSGQQPGQVNRVSADGLADPFSQWVDGEGEVAPLLRPAAMPPEGPDRLRAAMASVDLLTELDDIDRDDLPSLVMPYAAPAGAARGAKAGTAGGAARGAEGGTLEEILVAELGNALSRGVAIPPAANDRSPGAARTAPASAPTFLAQSKSVPDNAGRRPSAPPTPDRKTAEAAIDRQLLLNRIVRARDAIIAEEQEAARAAAANDPAPNGARKAVLGEAQDLEAPEYDTEIAERPGGITRLFTLRRMALAATAIALFAGASVTVGSGGFALPRFSAASFGQAMPQATPQGEVTETEAAEASAATARNPVSPPTVVKKPRAAADASAGPEPIAAAAEKSATPPAAQDAQLAERIGSVGPLALVPEQGSSAGEEAIRQRLLAGGGSRALQPAVAGTGGASLAAAATLVVNDAADGKSARADAELAPAAPPRAQGTLAAGLAPRDPSAVEAAMAATLGLSDLDASQREELKNLLVAGECPSQVLARMFGRAPVVATRDLVRNLENGC